MSSMKDYVTIADFAKAVGKSVVTIRQKCERGTLPGARKIGKNWIVRSDTEYRDARRKENAKLRKGRR